MTLAEATMVRQWRPITPHFGAELADGQLVDLDERAVADLVQLVAERGVVVARAQQMTIDEQIAFTGRFGEVYIHPVYSLAEHPEAIVIHADETTKAVGADEWHSDVSSESRPPGISVLRLETVPPSGGDTAYADMYRAFDTLSPTLRQFLLGLKARHISPSYYADSDRILRDIPQSVHPVVRTHPITRRKALYVNIGFTRKIVGLFPRESDALLKMLFDHIAYRVDLQLRVRWEPNTVTMWDNRCVQHCAVFDYFPEVRHGYRVTTVGEEPFLAPDEPPEA